MAPAALPPSTDVICEVWLVKLPAVGPCTFTVMVQDETEARLAPDTVIRLDPGTAVTTAPAQLLTSPLGELTTMPSGSVSVKPIPVRAKLALLFLIVNVSGVGVFNGKNGLVLAPVNAMVSTGGVTGGTVLGLMPFTRGSVIVRTAEAGAPAGASLEVGPVVALLTVPARKAKTLTEKEQVPLAAMTPPVKLSVAPPAMLLTVPPHGLSAGLRFTGVPGTMPPPAVPTPGRLSVKATPVSGEALGLARVKVIVDVPALDLGHPVQPRRVFRRAVAEGPQDKPVMGPSE